MVFSFEQKVYRPINIVIKSLYNADNIYIYHEDLLDTEVIEGEIYEEGFKMKMKFGYGIIKEEVMYEVIKNYLPNYYEDVYRSKAAIINVENHFTEIEKDVTLWRRTVKYSFRGWYRIIMFFLKEMLHDNTYSHMELLKKHVELTT